MGVTDHGAQPLQFKSVMMNLQSSVSKCQYNNCQSINSTFNVASLLFTPLCVSALCADILGLVKLTEILKNNPHVNEVEVPEKVGGFEEKEVSEAKEIFEAFRKQLAENKPKKGKGKKGGKKKKKKG